MLLSDGEDTMNSKRYVVEEIKKLINNSSENFSLHTFGYGADNDS